MKTLILLLAIPFAADTRDLGDSDFRVRHSATLRLQRAGDLAIPALTVAAESDSLERATRAADLLDRRPPLSLRIAEALVAADSDTVADQRLLPLRAALCVEFERLGEIRVYNPNLRAETTLRGGVAIYEWSLKEVHYGGSPAAELRLLLEGARERRRLLTATVTGTAAVIAK